MQAGEPREDLEGDVADLDPDMVAEEPAESLTFTDQKAWCRQRSAELVKEGKPRRNPKRCDECGTTGEWITRHHFDYLDPMNIAYYCRKHHEEADRERRFQEGSGEWSDAEVMEAINLVHLSGWTWQQVADHYGLAYGTSTCGVRGAIQTTRCSVGR